MTRPFSPFRLRVATLLFPPWGLVLLWRSPQTAGKKLLGTAGILLFGIPYSAVLVFLLVRFAGLQIEWRGGYLPALTRQRTAPDYAALERNRAQNQPAPVTNAPAVHSDYWNGFRGPNRDGRYDEQLIRTNWPATGLRLLWRQPCGGGYASFAVAAGLAFTIEQRRENEVVVAYDVETGREVWTQSWPAQYREYYSGGGPRATPAYANGQVYALGATGELRCLEAATGKIVWAKNILTDTAASEPTYGVSTSPLVVGDKLIVLTGAERGESVMCYNRHDGKKIWAALDDATGYASPMLVQLGGEPQLVICAATNTIGLRLADGAERWRVPWRVNNEQMPIAQPVALGTNRFLLSAGYFTGCIAFEVLPVGDGFTTKQLWRNKNLKNKFSSSVFADGFIYGLDEDILTCLDAATGERRWKDGRYGYGQMILASGHLVVLCGDGDLALVATTPERHEERARFPAIHGKTWNHPALSAGRLLVRNGAEMACFEVAAEK